ncbi:hypothetical protein M9Y10_024590 [Tritrichomonas musculus]|uniref:Protein kinase domain-containing protein n=1 Tax=Tritrichomonas musculus TaxID=1915356 RepID=A0ABR2HBY6_9EUKA
MFVEYIKYIDNQLPNVRKIPKKFPFSTYELPSFYHELEMEQKNSLTNGKGFVDLEKYEKEDKIRAGTVTSIFRVRDRMTGMIYSAKVANVRVDFSKEEVSNLSKEVGELTELKHPSIQQFHGYSFFNFNGQQQPVVIGEYSDNRTLFDIIQKQRKGKIDPNWDNTKKLINIYGIASAMKYLHSHGILHPNLRLENINVDDKLYPKLNEIGFYAQVENSQSVTSMSFKNKNMSVVSTQPEVFQKHKNDELSDVYTFAFVAYKILTNEIPFKYVKSVEQLYNEVANKKSRPVFKKNVPQIYQNLIVSCWSDDRNERPNFEVIVFNLGNNQQFITSSIRRKEFLNFVKYLDGSTQKKPEQTSTKHPPKKSKDIVRKRSVLPPLNRKHP